MASVMEIMRMTPSERLSKYQAKGIDVVKIDGTPFSDYKAFSFLWEKSYVKSPVRSGDGTIGNLNSYSTFLTPHLKIDFSVMSIDSYRKLMNLLYSKNEFVVECYDIVNDTITTNKMYFSTEEMPKLWTIVEALNGNEYAVELLGVQDYVVEMVGTNASFDTLEILYYDENGKLLAEATQTVDKGTEVIINYNYVPSDTTKRFDGEWLTEQGVLFKNGEAIRLTKNLKLTAKVVETNEYTLSFSYGNGNVLYSKTGETVNQITIKRGQTISKAIENANITLNNGQVFSFPSNGTGAKSIIVNDKSYTPYEFKGWYWTTEISSNIVGMVDPNKEFLYTTNRVIYQIYEPAKYSVEFNTNDTNISFDTINVAYSSLLFLPKPSKTGYTFAGWFTSNEFKEDDLFTSSSMPPYNLTLYAKWVKNE